MHPRLRSLIGTIVIICLVVIYAVAATAIASATLAQSPWWVHLAYFVLSGLLWILPAMLVIKWMAGSKTGIGTCLLRDIQRSQFYKPLVCRSTI